MMNEKSSQRQIRFAELIRSIISECLLVEDFYSLNFERHGVTYNFPPEVKFENVISLSYKIKDLSIFLDFENEYFEHYGFVDSNENVWNEIFEPTVP